MNVMRERSLQATIERAIAERDEALERVRQLEQLTRELDDTVRPAFGLTQDEGRVLAALMRWQIVGKQQLMALLYGHRDDPPGAKIIDQYIMRIRRKLKPHGIVIDTVWGEGWALDEAARAKLRDAAQADRPAGEGMQ